MYMNRRRATREIDVGGIKVGGGSPVSVQTMTKTLTTDTAATVAQIKEIHRAGGELVRVALPDDKAVEALAHITAASPIPVIGDVHFNPRLALKALDQGIAKLRVNPGNMGGKERLLQVATRAQEKGIPLRLGVNAGSLEKNVRRRYGAVVPEAMVESALHYSRILEREGFDEIIISLKASDVRITFEAYSLLAREVDYPFHIGITEAGPLYRGTVKSAVGIGSLLLAGLGDTVRVSLTADPVEEIKAARLILQSAGVRRFGPELISCPTCGRCEIDVKGLVNEVEEILAGEEKPLKIAVMGCVVNGPGEAREADLGVTGTPREGVIFKQGEIIRRVSRESLQEAFREEIKKICENGGGGPH